MRDSLLGAAFGLFVGMLGTIAYEHYLGLGPVLAQSRSDLVSANTNLAASVDKTKSEIDALSAQVDELSASNSQLKHQLDESKKPPQDAVPVVSDEIEQAHIDQELLRFKSRLNLSPEQEATLKASMEGVVSAIQNHTPLTKTVQQTLDEILTLEQKTANQQMLDDDKKSQADNTATYETNQAAGLLQLSEAQKDQVYSALYQIEMDQPSVRVIRSPSDIISYMDAQAQAKESAMAKVLTPEQSVTYNQQIETQLQAEKAAELRSLQVSAAAAKANPGVPEMSGTANP